MSKPIAIADAGFWFILFQSFHNANRTPEPESFRDYKSVRLAIFELRRRTGLTIEGLAFRVGILPSTLSTIELRHSSYLSQTHCLACKEIAMDFGYPVLAEFFDHQSLVSARTTRRRRNISSSDVSEHTVSGYED